MNSENQDNIEGKLEKLRRYGKKEEKDKIPEDVYLKTEKSKAPDFISLEDDEKSLEETVESTPATETREAVSEYERFQRLFEQGKSAYENGDLATAESKLLEAAYINPKVYGEEVLAYVANTADNKEKVQIGFYISSISAIPNREKHLLKLVETSISAIPNSEKSLEETETREAVSEYERFQRLFEQGKSAYESGDFENARVNLIKAARINPKVYGEEVLAYVANTADNKEKVYTGLYISSISAIPNSEKYLFKLVETRINLN